MLNLLVGVTVPAKHSTPIPSPGPQSSLSKYVQDDMAVSWPEQTRLSNEKTSVGSVP